MRFTKEKWLFLPAHLCLEDRRFYPAALREDQYEQVSETYRTSRAAALALVALET